MQDITDGSTHDYPDPTYVYVAVQGSNSDDVWEDINEVWVIVSNFLMITSVTCFFIGN